ncbi:odorant receptor 22a-like [Microplitis mediator]|uniref:odorant receptor 22a-like n=1 Tax=Microplitis mediator TaxID=375433 RepID=UPI00255607EC|nr:odorant receptor 22a-like [Microplitis mediator]
MKFFNHPDWRIGKLMLCSFGGWPYQSQHSRRILNFISIFTVQSIFVPEIFRLTRIWNSMEMIVECVPMISLHIVANIKMFNCIINLNKVKVLLEHIERYYQSDLCESELRILYKDRHNHKKVISVYVFYIYSIAVVFASIPVLSKVQDLISPLNESRPKVYLYPAEYFVDQDKYSTYIYIHGYMALPITMTLCTAYDFLYSACGHHVCSMFKIAGNRLKHIIDNKIVWSKNESLDHSNRQDEVYKSLIECVKMHKFILNYVDCYQKTFSDSLFLVIGVNMLALCITSLQSLITMNQFHDAVSYIVFAFGQLIHLFLLNYQGQNIINHSENFYNDAYQTNWHEFSKKSRKLFILIVMRSSEFSVIRAGKIYVMSSDSFSNVLKTAMSYLMVLNSLR